MNPCRSKGQSDPEIFVSGELRRGREATTELLGLIRHQKDLDEAAFGLVARIVDSFSNSLSLLGCQDLGIGGPRGSNKSSSSCAGTRLRKVDSSWTRVTSSALIADGYAWRKYGQKPILNAKHPRSYFRCAKRPHCQALKRVQKMDDDDDPPMYKIARTGHHTCENSPNLNSSVFLSFDTEKNNEQSNSSDRLATSQCTKLRGINQQGGYNLPSGETITSSPKNVQWSLDDYDYLIGSVDFNDHHAF